MSSISEFERTKPRETMKAINKLINSLDDIIQNNSSANPSWVKEEVVKIKSLLMEGR